MHKPLSTPSLLLIIRLIGAAAGLLFQLLLARVLRPADLGTFFAASSLAAILGICAAQGYPAIAARFISRYVERKKRVWLASFLTISTRNSLMASALAALLVVAAANVPFGVVNQDVRLAFSYAGISIPAFMSLTLLGSFGVAKRNFASALVPELVIRPLLLVLFVAAMLVSHTPITASDAILVFVGLTVLLAIIQHRLIWRDLPNIDFTSSTSLSRRWRTEAWTLLIPLLFSSFFADLTVVVAAPFLPAAELAAFGVSIKIAMIVGFGVQVAHQVILPDLSEAYARRQKEEIAGLLLRAAPFPIAFASLSFFITILFGRQALFLFGPEFGHAWAPLVLLVGCQIVRALAGPNQAILTLEGAQRLSLAICALACLVLLLGNAVLSSSYGLWGSVIATVLAYLVWILGGGLVLPMISAVRTDIVSVVMQSASRRSNPIDSARMLPGIHRSRRS